MANNRPPTGSSSPLDDDDPAPAVTQAEHAARTAPEHQISLSEKRGIAIEASREEDA